MAEEETYDLLNKGAFFEWFAFYMSLHTLVLVTCHAHKALSNSSTKRDNLHDNFRIQWSSGLDASSLPLHFLDETKSQLIYDIIQSSCSSVHSPVHQQVIILSRHK
jgi:hypothetical protein